MMGTLSSYTLVFIHMPKAAGSTLQRIIERQYGGQNIFNIDGNDVSTVQVSIDHLRSLSGTEREKVLCLKGHVPFGIGQWLKNPVKYISMLREPVARIVSDYNYAASTPEHILYKRVNEENMSLIQFAEMRAQSGLANLYTRLLSGCVNWDNIALSKALLSQTELESAKENVRKCAAIGITEHFDESILIFKKALGWSSCGYIRENVTREERVSRRAINSDVEKAIEEYNRLDMELYKYCREILDETIQKAGSDFQAELAAFRKENSA